MDFQRKHSGAAAVLQAAKDNRPMVHRIKIITMGDAGVGKSCLVKRYCEERFVSQYLTTVGIDYGVKRVAVDGTDVRVNFWDLAGDDSFEDTRTEFYENAQGAALVFDVTNPASFTALQRWLDEARKHGAKDVVTAVCANKTDLPNRRVPEAEARKWAMARGYAYYETSAQSGQAVAQMFETLFRDTFMLAK